MGKQECMTRVFYTWSYLHVLVINILQQACFVFVVPNFFVSHIITIWTQSFSVAALFSRCVHGQNSKRTVCKSIGHHGQKLLSYSEFPSRPPRVNPNFLRDKIIQKTRLFVRQNSNIFTHEFRATMQFLCQFEFQTRFY